MSILDKMTDQDLPYIFIINMQDHAERRDIMSERLKALALEFSFFPAVNGYQLDYLDAEYYDRKKRLRYFGRDLRAGEMGCLLSHRNIYQTMVDQNISHALILEDDVMFDDDFKALLSSLMEKKRHWDVLRFLGSEKIYKRGCRKIEPINDKYSYARLPTAPGGAHAYILSRKAAKTMLAHMQRNWLPIDTLQGRSWQTGLETLTVYPAPCRPDPAQPSTIGDERFDKTPILTGIDLKLFPLNRALFKLNETFGKKMVYFGSYMRDAKKSRAA